MAMKIYRVGEYTRQYEEGSEPEGAVLVETKKKAVQPSDKAVKPANKSRKAVKKK